MVFNLSEFSFGLVSISTGLLSFVLALAVFLGNPHLKENRTWALAGLSTGLWAFGLGFATISPDKRTSFLWNQIFYTGSVWIPTTFLWFVSNFTRNKIPASIPLISTLISSALTLVLWLRPGWFIVDLVPREQFRFWEIVGPVYNGFSLFFFAGMGYSIWKLFRHFKSGDSPAGKKSGWLVLGVTVGVFGGATTFFYDYNINIFPFGQFLVFLYPLLISWTIVKHQALDVGILFRKTGLLIGIYACLICAVVPILFLLQEQMGHNSIILASMMLVEVLVAALVLSLGPFLYAFFVQRSVIFHEHTLAGITHELKSPLAVMDNALEILSDKLDRSRLDPSVGEYLEILNKNRLRLERFVNDLLNVYRVSNKKELLVTNEVDLVQLCEEIIGEHKPLAEGRGVGLIFHCRSKSGNVFCRFDREKIKQVLSNLISNALKYTRDGSVTVELAEGEKEAAVSVEDTGIGIPKPDLPYVFDRFFQGQKKSQVKGTGLGLAIAKMWVEAHGGEIHVSSDGEGKGARFRFTLPK